MGTSADFIVATVGVNTGFKCDDPLADVLLAMRAPIFSLNYLRGVCFMLLVHASAL